MESLAYANLCDRQGRGEGVSGADRAPKGERAHREEHATWGGTQVQARRCGLPVCSRNHWVQVWEEQDIYSFVAPPHRWKLASCASWCDTVRRHCCVASLPKGPHLNLIMENKWDRPEWGALYKLFRKWQERPSQAKELSPINGD